MAIAVVEYAWLSYMDLKIPPPLIHKRTAYFVGPFPVLRVIALVSF